MNDFQARLFLGFPIRSDFAQKLAKIPSPLISAIINEGDRYLQEFPYEGIRYLGKVLNGYTEYPNLELLEINIYSLLKKLVPDYPYDQAPLILIATP